MNGQEKAEPSEALHFATGGSPQKVVMGDVWIATSIIAIAVFRRLHLL